MAKDYLDKGIETEAVQAYLKFMVDNAVLFGGNREIAERELKDALEFEIKLAEVRKIYVKFCFFLLRKCGKFLILEKLRSPFLAKNAEMLAHFIICTR